MNDPPFLLRRAHTTMQWRWRYISDGSSRTKCIRSEIRRSEIRSEIRVCVATVNEPCFSVCRGTWSALNPPQSLQQCLVGSNCPVTVPRPLRYDKGRLLQLAMYSTVCRGRVLPRSELCGTVAGLSTSIIVPVPIAVELVEAILIANVDLFHQLPPFTAMLRQQVCPLIVRLLKGEADFPVVLRLVSVKLMWRSPDRFPDEMCGGVDQTIPRGAAGGG